LPSSESPQLIQELIDVVKKNLEILHQIKDAKEVDKESVVGLINDWKETSESNEYFQKHFQELTTPDHSAQFVSDAQPHMDPITAGLLFSGVAVGIVADSMAGKWIAETAKEFAIDIQQEVGLKIEQSKSAWETGKERLQEEVGLKIEHAKWALETGKERLQEEVGLKIENAKWAWETGKERLEEGWDKAKDIAQNALDKTKDLVLDIGDPVLVAKEKEQAVAREKWDADLNEQMKFHEKRCAEKGIVGDEKTKFMKNVEKAAQAATDKMIQDQAKELERMRQMEDLHRARF
jgi:hypothetical protein